MVCLHTAVYAAHARLVPNGKGTITDGDDLSPEGNYYRDARTALTDERGGKEKRGGVDFSEKLFARQNNSVFPRFRRYGIRSVIAANAGRQIFPSFTPPPPSLRTRWVSGGDATQSTRSARAHNTNGRVTTPPRRRRLRHASSPSVGRRFIFRTRFSKRVCGSRRRTPPAAPADATLSPPPTRRVNSSGKKNTRNKPLVAFSASFDDAVVPVRIRPCETRRRQPSAELIVGRRHLVRLARRRQTFWIRITLGVFSHMTFRI